MKTYTCICGRTFDNPQKFNGHKQGWKQHILTEYKSLQEYYQMDMIFITCMTKINLRGIMNYLLMFEDINPHPAPFGPVFQREKASLARTRLRVRVTSGPPINTNEKEDKKKAS